MQLYLRHLMLAFIVLFAIDANANEQAEIEEFNKERGESLFTEGISFLEKDDFKTALEFFIQANSFQPSAKTVEKIATCYEKLERYGDAIKSYKEILFTYNLQVSAEKKEQIKTEIERIESMVGQFEILAINGIDIYVNGVSYGTTPLSGAITVKAQEENIVEFKIDEEVIYSDKKTVEAKETMQIVFFEKTEDENVKIVMAGDLLQDSFCDERTKKVQLGTSVATFEGRKKIHPGPFFAAAGSTVVLLGTAIGMSVYVNSNNSDVVTSKEADLLNGMRKAGLITLFSGIGTGVLTGVLAVFTDFKSGRKSFVQVVALPNEAGAFYTRRF